MVPDQSSFLCLVQAPSLFFIDESYSWLILPTSNIPLQFLLSVYDLPTYWPRKQKPSEENLHHILPSICFCSLTLSYLLTADELYVSLSKTSPRTCAVDIISPHLKQEHYSLLFPASSAFPSVLDYCHLQINMCPATINVPFFYVSPEHLFLCNK